MELQTGLWNKTSKNGKVYANGKIEITEPGHYRITQFVNTEKKTEKSPNYSLILENVDLRPEEEKTGVVSVSQDIILTDDDLPF